jgi:porin
MQLSASIVALLFAFSATAQPAEGEGESDGFPKADSSRLNEIDAYQDPDERKAHFKWDWLDEKLDPVQEFKNRLNEEWGLDFFLAYSPQIMAASQEDNQTNIAHEVDLIGEWRLVDNETTGKGRLQFWFLSVRTLGDKRGAEFQEGAGSAWEFNDLDTGTDNDINAIGAFYWEQLMFKDHLRLVFGKMDPRLFLNTNRFLWNDRTLFNMGTMSADPVNSVYGSRGLGGVAEINFGGFYVGGLFVDANAKTNSIDFKRFDNGTYSWAAEVGYETTIEGLGEGNYRASVFHTDSTGSGAASKSVMGNAITMDQDLGENYAFFAHWSRRAGGKGSLSQNLSTGFVLRKPFGIEHDLVGVGFTWGRPDNSTKDDQYGIEAFWRFQILDRMEFSPVLQYIIDPVDSNTKSRVVGGARVRVYL